LREILNNCTGFDWDEGNSDKNWVTHRVSRNESEQVFFNEPFIIAGDMKYSQNEKRWYLLGITDSQRLLFISFTIRNSFIRVISARDMNKKERKVYDEQA